MSKLNVQHIDELIIDEALKVAVQVSGSSMSILEIPYAKPQPQPRTKVEYVKVEDSIFDLRSSLESGELYYKDIDDKFYEISGESQLVNCFDSSCVYRRIETEITERDEFIDAALESVKLKHIIVVKDAIENMFDSGKFKLVD